MATVTIDELNENILSMRKELEELKQAMLLSNRQELAQAAREARAGVGTWHSINKV